MNPIAILLVFGGCISEALYNIFIKIESKENTNFKNHVALFTSSVSGVATILLFITSIFTGGPELTPGWWIPIVITGILAGGILHSEIKAMSLEDVSLVVPIATTTPALVVITSLMILGERPSWRGWVGIQLIVIGTYILNIQAFLDKKKEAGGRVNLKDWLAPFLMFKKSIGVRYAYLCVLLATFSLNYEAIAVRKTNIAFASGCIFGICTILNFIFAYYKEADNIRQATGIFTRNFLIVSFCLFLGVLLPAAAFRFDIVPYVGTLKRFQIPLTIILAYYFVGEKQNFKNRFLGSMIMVSGLFLMISG